jgi:hypothetical protein
MLGSPSWGNESRLVVFFLLNITSTLDALLESFITEAHSYRCWASAFYTLKFLAVLHSGIFYDPSGEIKVFSYI